MDDKVKILIVEDNEDLNTVIKIKLRKFNYDMTGIHSGKEVTAWCAENDPDLILLDYRLDGLTAKDVVDDLKKKGMEFPFIILTGYGDQGTAVEMMKLGAIDYITKEVAFIDNLPPVIDKAIKLIKTKKELKEMLLQIQKSEEKYRSIFNNIQDIYFELSLNGEILEISPSVETILHYKREEVIGTLLTNYFVDYEKTYGLIKQFSSGRKFDNFELLLLDKNGESRYCSISSNLINGRIVGSVRDITEQKRLENKILNAVIETEEKERKRISQDLHDSIGPLLSSVKMYVNVINKGHHTEKRRKELLKYTNELIDDSIKSIRTTANNLTPSILNDFGLTEALKSYCNKINESKKIKISFNSNLDERINAKKEIILYRIFQELINNTLKHADAKNVMINISNDNEMLTLKYSDDGKGFDINEALSENYLDGMGLRNIISKSKSINAAYRFKSNNNGFSFTLKLLDIK